MNLSSFKHLVVAGICVVCVQSAQASDVMEAKDTIYIHDTIYRDTCYRKANVLSRYESRVQKYRKHWDVLIPTQGVFQVCGNMGLFSLGIGWDYGKRSQWETHLLFGYIPKFSSDDERISLTLKENFIPWRRDIGKGWFFEPLECSIYLNTVFGHDFWTKQPTKYENGYYPFSTRVRPNLALGERFRYDIPHDKRKRGRCVMVYYELGTNDIYFMRFFRNGNAHFWDVFGLSFGAIVQFL